MNKRNEQLYKEMLETASNRRTAKQYNPEANIDKETLKKIFAFSKTAPSSMGLEFVRIVSIDRDSEHKKGINEYFKEFNQERAYMASNLAILVSKKASFFTEDNELINSRSVRMMKTIANLKGEEYVPGSEKGYVDAILNSDHADNGGNKEEWSARQAYIQLGYILLGASSLGVETTTIEGYKTEMNDYLREHGIIQEDERVTLVVAMGYVDSENKLTFVGDKQIRIEDDEYVKYH